MRALEILSTCPHVHHPFVHTYDWCACTHSHTCFNQVFGDNPWIWFLPVGRAVGDGVHWETNENLHDVQQNA
jgi:hypothetical protein